MGISKEVIIKLSAVPDATLNEALKLARKQVEDLSKEITDLAAKATVGFGAFAAGSVVIAKGWLDAAGTMEQYRAKLETVLKSSVKAQETISKAVEFASKTPFDVKGVVDATVQLEVYGQKSEKWLPLVGDLAAGMGKDIKDTSLVIGKALSGSLEGFESLRNEYGISTRKLVQYGAVMNDMGGISLKTGAEVDKARNALQQVIQTGFGGAMERQSKTWQGAMSNLSDSVDKLKVALGQELVPAATAAARGITSMIEGFNTLGGSLKPTIAWGTVIAGGLAAMMVPITGLIALLPSLSMGWQILSKQALIASTSLNAAKASMLGVMATPMGVALTAITAIYLGLSYSISQWEKQSIKVAAQLEKESKALQDAATQWRNYKMAVDKATGGKTILPESRNVGENLRQIGIEMGKLSDEQKTSIFKSLGYDAKSLNTEFKDTSKKVLEARQELDAFIKIRDNMQKGPGKGETTTPEEKGIFKKYFPEGATIDQVNGRINDLTLSFDKLKGSQAFLASGLGLWVDIDDRIKQAARSMKDLTVEYDIMKGTNAFKKPSEELDYLMKKIPEAQKIARDLSAVSGSGFKLNLGDIKGTEEQIRSLKFMLADYQKALDNPDLKKDEKLYNTTKAQADATKDVILFMEKGVAAAKANNDKRLSDSKTYIDQQKALNNMNLDEEIRANTRLLDNDQLTAEQRKEINEKITQLKRDKLVEGRENTEREIQKELNAVKLMATGQVKEYDRIIAKIKEKQAAGKITEKQTYELTKTAEEGKKTQAEKDEKDSYDRRVKANENFFNIMDKQEDMSNDERLSILDSMERAWYEAERQRVITTQQAEDQIMKVHEKRAALMKKITDANKAAEQELINLRKQALDYDIKRLGDKAKAGQNVEKELLRKVEDRGKLELKAVQQKAYEMEKQGIEPDRVQEFTARKESEVYRQQADQIGAIIEDLKSKITPDMDRLEKMGIEGQISSLTGQQQKYEGYYKSATNQADIAQQAAEAKGLNSPAGEKTPFETASFKFSDAVGIFSTSIGSLVQALGGQLPAGVPGTSSGTLPAQARVVQKQIAQKDQADLTKYAEGSPERQEFYRQLVEQIKNVGEGGSAGTTAGANVNAIFNFGGAQTTGNAGLDLAAKNVTQQALKHATDSGHLKDISLGPAFEGASY